MKLVHIRVPGRNSVAHLSAIRDAYIKGTLDFDRMSCTILDIDETQPFWIGARYSHPSKKADIVIKDLADSTDETVRESIRVGIDESVIATDARFVIVATDQHGSDASTDEREAKARANASFFAPDMWTIRTAWRPKGWSRPRFVIYDYDGRDGRKVWSWVFHFGPWWFIRERYAL